MVYGYIYKIENLANSKIYIGQTTQKPIKRFNSHLFYLKKDQHFNKHLQNSFNNHGIANFKFTVLNYATDKKTLNKLEQTYIQYYDCLNKKKGYNLQTGGTNGKASLETRKKLSGMRKGHLHHFYGKTFSEEYRSKLSKAHKGKKLSLKTRKKVSENNARYWLGKTHSQETKNKLSAAKKGKKLSLEHRKKMSDGGRGQGLFGFTGAALRKEVNPEKKCWKITIYWNTNQKFIGLFNDPLSCEIIHDLILNEIY